MPDPVLDHQHQHKLPTPNLMCPKAIYTPQAQLKRTGFHRQHITDPRNTSSNSKLVQEIEIQLRGP